MCSSVRTHIRGSKEKKIAGGLFFYSSIRLSSVPRFRYYNIQYISRPPQKPVTVPHRGPKYLHSVGCGGLPSVAERAEDRDLFLFSVFVFFSLSSFDVLSARTTEIRPRRRCRYLYIGMFYVLCQRISRRYALPHVYSYTYIYNTYIYIYVCIIYFYICTYIYYYYYYYCI